MKSLLAAIRFLTVLPLPARTPTPETGLGGSVAWFPVVGLLLGILAAGAGWGITLITPQSVASVLVIVLLLTLSGGLHLDGLADTADGVFSSRSRGEMLRIMRDSRIGAMGVMTLSCVLLLKYAALSSLPPAYFWRAVLLTPLAGRCALVFHLAWLPYARPQGLGSAFFQTRSHWAVASAFLLLALVGFLILGIAGVILAVLCAAVAGLLAYYFYRVLGGATGDTLGAACEIVELVPAMFLTVAHLQNLR